MNDFEVFILQNWKVILAISLSIANLLVCIFKKKTKVVDSVEEFILKCLPYYIRVAEDFGNLSSDEKKSMVITSLSNVLESHFDGIDFEKYIDFINDSIESILSTPQKKGV